MAITITGPLGTPVVNLALVAGGSLDPNKTYYIRVVARYYISYWYWDYRDRQSVPSVEASIMTNPGNQSIQVNWAAIPGANGYDIYISETSGDYKASDYPRIAATWGTYNPSCGASPYTITAMPDHVGGNAGIAFHTFSSERDIPLDPELGSILINFDGAVTLTDIYNAIVAAGHGAYCYWDGCNFVLKGSLYVNGANAGSLTALSINFIFVHGSLRNTNPNVALTFGSKTGTRPHNGCNFNMIGWCLIYCQAPDKFYDCNFKWPAGDDAWVTAESGIWGYYAGTLEYIDGTIEQFRTNLRLIPYQNMSTFEALRTDDHTIQIDHAVTLSDFLYKFGYITVNNYSAVLRDFETTWDFSINFMMLLAGAGNFKIYNPSGFWNAGNKPRIHWAQKDAQISQYYTVELKVIDIDGNNIVGASFELDDTDGTTVWSGVTDGSGEASQDILAVISTWLGPGDFDSNYDDRSPFTLKIYMAGYQKYRQIFDLEEKTSWIITLKPSSINVDAEQLCDIH